jgi:hypothetical protein
MIGKIRKIGTKFFEIRKIGTTPRPSSTFNSSTQTLTHPSKFHPGKSTMDTNIPEIALHAEYKT